MNKRIYILYTGGTIGMQRSERGYVPMSGLDRLLAEKIPPHLSASVPEYQLEELETLIDSTNATPADWRQIAQKVVDNYASYDGFIILHGTDTLAYTASALSFMLQGLQKPVIVTGSQIPLSELRNDALDNLITALVLARNHPVAEVCLYFSGRLLRGNRASKLKATGFDAFDSPNCPPLGQVGIHIEMDHSLIRTPNPSGESFELPHYNKRIMPLRLYPGICGEDMRFLLQRPLDGLILESFGVGNAPDRDADLLKALQQAISGGLVVVNRSQCLYGRVDSSSYATGSALAKTGVVGAADMTLEATFTKLHHLLATQSDPERVRQLMATDLCGELTPA